MVDVRYKFRVQTMFGSSLVLLLFVLFTLSIFITYAGVQHDLYILCCSCHLVLRRRLSPVKSELFTPLYFFSGIRVSQSFVFCVVCLCEHFLFVFLSFCHFIVCPSNYKPEVNSCAREGLAMHAPLVTPVV